MITTEFIIGFFTGTIIAGVYSLWFIYQMKKRGYIKTEPAKKKKKNIK